MKRINKFKNIIIALVICAIFAPIDGLKNSIGSIFLSKNTSLGVLFLTNVVIIWLAFTGWDLLKKITHEAIVNQNSQ